MAQYFEDGLGGSITITERGDDTAPMKCTMVMPKGFGPPAPEMHPGIEEDFRIVRGKLDLGQVNGEHVVLSEGETFTLPAGTMHKPSNAGDDELVMELTLTPGRELADMFSALYTQTKDYGGLGQFARVAMVFRRYQKDISFPLPVRATMAVVAFVASLLGLRIQAPNETAAPEAATL